MSIRSTRPETYQTNTIDTQRTVVHELRRLKNAVDAVTISTGAINVSLTGVATEATLQFVYSELSNISSILQDIETGQDDLTNLLSKANWTSTVGNSIELTYYTGIAAGNPSGSTSNIETTVYKTGVSIIFTQTMTYNAANLVTSVTTT